jgi:protein-S-isoprenylcysteine O-methyltransferase Ste14
VHSRQHTKVSIVKPPFYRQAAAASYYFERYVLSLAYLYFAWREVCNLDLLSASLPQAGGIGSPEFLPVVQHVILLLLQLFVGLTLLCSHKPQAQPRNLKEILVPLAGTFFVLAYSVVPRLPAVLRQSLFPAGVQAPCAAAALILGIIGPAISTWGVMSLGRSFGIFVSVRQVVLRGPYQYVRHPIYLGYVFVCAGLVLANLSIAIIVLVAVHLALLVYRARLEEARLAEHSAEYREYVRHTGFIFPRLGGDGRRKK